MDNKQKKFNIFSWSLLLASVLLPSIAWGNSVNWNIANLTGYQWFPLFGLLAWMMMATHYYTWYFIAKDSSLKKTRSYLSFSTYAVLAMLILHPGVLAYSQWTNNQGLPPDSFTDYVGQSLQLAVFLGSFSLILFLSYEIFMRIKNKPSVNKNWWLINITQTLAMILIFVHALSLGSVVGDGWFRVIWFAYGILLLPCFYVVHKSDFTKSD